MQIESGTGNGHKAGVTEEGHLEVHSITESLERHVNSVEGEAYHLVFNQSPTAADDCIAYISNTSEKNMFIEGISIGVTSCTADDSIYFQINDRGTRNAATALTPTTCNAGSGHQATGTFERGADLDGGAATLAGGVEIDRYLFVGTDLSSTHYNFEQDIIIPKNNTFTIWVGGSATGTYYLTVVFNYHD